MLGFILLIMAAVCLAILTPYFWNKDKDCVEWFISLLSGLLCFVGCLLFFTMIGNSRSNDKQTMKDYEMVSLKLNDPSYQNAIRNADFRIQQELYKEIRCIDGRIISCKRNCHNVMIGVHYSEQVANLEPLEEKFLNNINKKNDDLWLNFAN